MEQTRNILDKLAGLSLAKYPIQDIYDFIKKLGVYGQMSVNMPIGTHILRARENKKDEIFCCKNQLTYKPQEYNTTFQRASTPNNTMFYGSVYPESQGQEEEDWLNIITLLEICELAKNDSIKEGEQIVTFSAWTVSEKIPLASTIYHFDILTSSNFIRKLKDDFEQQLQNNPDIFQEKTKLICDFFDNEFSKEDTCNEYDYLLSAIYTDIITQYKVFPIAGVLYPSVRIKKHKGKGFNVAITPEFTDKCLRLDKVVECTVYKKNGYVICDGEKEARIEPGQEVFTLRPITNPEHRRGRENIYKFLNSKNNE